MRLLCALLALLCYTHAPPIEAAGYPERPIRLIVPFGTQTGATIRPVTEAMSQALGVPILLIHQPGAGGTIGAQELIKSAPDGYTLGFMVAANMIMATRMQPPYDPQRDLAYVGFFHLLAPTMLVSSRFKSVEELRAANGTRLNWGSTLQSTMHLAGLQFLSLAGVQATHVPHAETPRLLQEVIGGILDFAAVPGSSVQGFSTDGPVKLHVLAQLTAARSAFFPDVPTAAEAGVPEFKDAFPAIGALAAPKGTPEKLLRAVRKAMQDALRDPQVLARLAAAGVAPLQGGPEEVSEWIDHNTALWNRIIDTHGLQRQ